MFWLGIPAALLAYALGEPYWIRAVEHTVEVPDLPDQFHGFSILHLSDIHGRVGVFSWRPFLRWLAEADMVAVTGDLYSPSLPRHRLAARMRQLSAPDGVFYISGNHDYRGGKLMVEPWDPGDQLIDNQVREIRRGDASLWIAGLPDFVKGRPDWSAVRRQLQERSGPAILLAHRPDAWLLEGVERVSLILAGHTHGGQVVIPVYGAPLKHNRVPGRYVAGRLESPDKPVLITSRGLGTSELPVRFLARPEVLMIRLVKSRR
ncbi:metallophosphoesterase [Sulfobacillus harzensis]|uniref:Metallophosphoesterase n=1 Tax=Sulfobacillus harzensis TaxID=2729629 RepID=A0A7Y0L5K0_9FIRM|nr:metallophosphoesterase [Sulfobacillus harzensis]NMP22284.1 metallophosphoesterase [Sulfobacillus harzensis]